jgi:hypothetical protein
MQGSGRFVALVQPNAVMVQDRLTPPQRKITSPPLSGIVRHWLIGQVRRVTQCLPT